MNEYHYEEEVFSLSDLLRDIRNTLKLTYFERIWVIAEIAAISKSQRGHVYFELVEKNDEQVIAKTRANLWSSKRMAIMEKFERTTRESLKKGMKVLLLTEVEFHQVYSFSLMIHDIDPSFSLGEMARKKQETIELLKKEKLFNLNHQFILPKVIQKIAVITSPDAAGYQDLIEHLTKNSFGYVFFPVLFKATVQGEHAANSIVSAFNAIEKSKEKFDAILLIRGGGSSIDLSCFDEYHVAKSVANATIPVITGIGHEKDNSIADMVANTCLKTPTAVANFLIDRASAFEKEIDELMDQLLNHAHKKINYEKEIFQYLSRNFYLKNKQFLQYHQSVLWRLASSLHHNARALIKNHTQWMNSHENRLKEKTFYLVKNEKQRLTSHIQYLKLADPYNLLKKGFSITYKNGQALKSNEEVEEGDYISTKFYKGNVDSKITRKS